MVVIITRWGILKYNPILDFYVNWDFIKDRVQNEPYIISKWFFTNVSKIFKSAYVIPERKKYGVENNNDIKKLVKQLEVIEGIIISDNKKQEIQTETQQQLFSLDEDNWQDLWIEFDINPEDVKQQDSQDGSIFS